MNTVTTTSDTQVPIELGQLYKHTNREVYIVSGDRVNVFFLISLNDGDLFLPPCDSIAEVFGDFKDNFTRVYSATITYKEGN